MARFSHWLVALACLASPLAVQSELKVGEVSRRIELHYNRLATFQTEFEQVLTYAGIERDRERGTLYLLRPQRMRWEYSKPKGKLLVGNGQILETYNPYSNQVRKLRLEDSADLRGPLSFLLGRLDFSRQFKNLELTEIDGRLALVGEGRTGKEVYGRVEFYFEPDEDFRLSALKAYGRDESITDFRFWNEKTNETLETRLFTFQAPAGAEILPETSLGGDR